LLLFVVVAWFSVLKRGLSVTLPVNGSKSKDQNMCFDECGGDDIIDATDWSCEDLCNRDSGIVLSTDFGVISIMMMDDELCPNDDIMPLSI